jgi:hypothetical protein
MADKNCKSNIVFGDKRDDYNGGMWVSSTRSVQTAVAVSSANPAQAKKMAEERERVAEMKKGLQTSSLHFGSANHDESTWQSSNYQKPLTQEEQEEGRGKLDPKVAARISKSK